MTLTLTLPHDLEVRLKCEAEARGVSEAEHAVGVLDQHLPHTVRKEKLRVLLQSIIEESRNADADTDAAAEELFKAIDEDRLSDRKLFPPELKGKTW